MPRLTKQQKPPARPPAVSAATMTVHAKRFNSPNVPELLASLADKYGVKPSDIPLFLPAHRDLARTKVDPLKITPHQIAEAGGLWRAGIADSMRCVDAMNTATLKRLGDENRVAEGGDVRTLQRRVEPEIVKAKTTTDKPRKNGLEILGSPATYLLQAMGRAGFSVSAARAAFDELGGMGVHDSMIRNNLKLGAAEETASLTAEQLEELEPFRNAKPEPREEEQRLPCVVVPSRSVKTLD